MHVQHAAHLVFMQKNGASTMPKIKKGRFCVARKVYRKNVKKKFAKLAENPPKYGLSMVFRVGGG